MQELRMIDGASKDGDFQQFAVSLLAASNCKVIQLDPYPYMGIGGFKGEKSG